MSSETDSSDRGRDWSPHFWVGCNLSGWMRLLALNRFRVHWRYWLVAFLDTLGTIFNSAMGLVELACYGRRMRRVRLDPPPVFILGHWRSGTTLLHELLALDERLAAPTTYQCFAPNHFLLTERLFTRFFGFLIPQRRPMDDMEAGWQRPQEDEFALANMGLPSPYCKIAFPNQPDHFPESFDLRELPDADRQHWRRRWLWFLRRVAWRHGERRLVLKSPPHTARIKAIREIFPEAKFIHIVRDPYQLFPSTMKLWRRIYEKHGYQPADHSGLERFVFATLRTMYERFEEDSRELPADSICDVRYEDLTRDPLAELRRVYERLGLGDVEPLAEAAREYLSQHADYMPGSYELSDQQQREIEQNWASYFDNYGYLPSRV